MGRWCEGEGGVGASGWNDVDEVLDVLGTRGSRLWLRDIRGATLQWDSLFYNRYVCIQVEKAVAPPPQS